MPTADVWAVLSFSAGSDAQPHGGPSTPAAPPPPHADVLDCPADIGVATLESGSPSAVAAATVEGRRDGERTGATAHGESAAWDGWWLPLLSTCHRRWCPGRSTGSSRVRARWRAGRLPDLPAPCIM